MEKVFLIMKNAHYYSQLAEKEGTPFCEKMAAAGKKHLKKEIEALPSNQKEELLRLMRLTPELAALI